MKLTYEDKVQIYELRKQGQTFNQLSKRFGLDASGLRYMTRLIERYGIEIIKKGKQIGRASCRERVSSPV